MVKFKALWDQTAQLRDKAADLTEKANDLRDKAIDLATDKVTEIAAKEQFDGVRDKVEKLNDNKHVGKLRDMAVDQLTKPRTNSDVAKDVVIGVGISVITGGTAAIPMAIARGAAQGYAQKKFAETKAAKKIIAANEKLKNKPKDGPQPGGPQS